MPNNNVLTEQDRISIDEQLEKLKEAAEIIETAIRAGINVEEFRVRQQQVDRQLRQLKQAFFPGQ